MIIDERLVSCRSTWLAAARRDHQLAIELELIAVLDNPGLLAGGPGRDLDLPTQDALGSLAAKIEGIFAASDSTIALSVTRRSASRSE
ncbi:MAG: hypothetical protein DWQ31_06935 [Planctomycetota bacterium]|nr:MAG: hypothetical protein DWQ31_06935 [Planctomycetota bacterium]REJ97801.1 MAG: hypothetical protein DWQ35_01305 [Planctomycetota bacterium]